MRESRPTAALQNRDTGIAAPRRLAGLLAVAGAITLVAASAVTGYFLDRNGFHLHLGNSWPLSGHIDPRLTGWILVPLTVAGVWVWLAPKAQRLPWRGLVAVVALVAAVWPLALALIDGPAAITAPLLTPYEYLNDVDRVTDLGGFLAGFNEYVLEPPRWTTHVGGHPPGLLGLLALADRIGLGGAGWLAALCLAGGVAAALSVLSTTRVLGGEELARRAAPFVAASPAALWIATSADAFFAGVAAAGVCALAHAAVRHDRRGDAYALLGGLLLGSCLFLSYGLTLIGLLAIAVVAVRRRVRPLLVGGAAVVALMGLMAWAGFWWPEGLWLATERVKLGQGWIDRPTWYFIMVNLAALSIAVGPAVVAGLASLRRSVVAVVPVAIAGAILLAFVSNLSKGEAERIYLPFAVWLLPFAGLLSAARVWLAAQLALALLVGSTVSLWW